MPPKRIEDQPVIDPASTDMHMEDTSDAPTQKKRRETIAIHGDRLRRQLESRGKIPLTFHKCHGRPIGTNATSFMTELSVAVKKFSPLQVTDWRKIREEQKR
ncbi:hypothetical protein Pfo_010289, partial [Paulownia fortunei]